MQTQQLIAGRLVAGEGNAEAVLDSASGALELGYKDHSDDRDRNPECHPGQHRGTKGLAYDYDKPGEVAVSAPVINLELIYVFLSLGEGLLRFGLPVNP